MKKVFVTRKIAENGIALLREKGYQVDVSDRNRPLTEKELIKALSRTQYDAVVSLLTDTIGPKVFDYARTVKVFANYAIGYNNIDVAEAKKRQVYVSNAPSGGFERVAEHTWALILALACRVVEGNTYVHAGKYTGWDPMLLNGPKISGSTIGLVGLGNIGAEVARRAKAFNMKIVYYDIKRNEQIEKETGAVFSSGVDDVLKVADIVSIHVPLLESTHHLLDARRLSLMKPTACLINTSRGPVVDEMALADTLKRGALAGAGLDVFEFEPKITKDLLKLSNVILTPHIASATREAREEMSRVVAMNVIDCLEGGVPRNNLWGTLPA